MAVRPIFIPHPIGPSFVKIRPIEFEWFPGLSLSQARKSIASLHRAASQEGFSPLLEISSKSDQPLGVSLSAFNLMLETREGRRMSVECAFQGSKVFQNGGPYTDLYGVSSKEAKTDERIRSSGELIAFEFVGEAFPTTPATAFYDWLYLQALAQNPDPAKALMTYGGFTDIAFNPKKSLNCQARSAALFVALRQSDRLDRAIQNRNWYLELAAGLPDEQRRVNVRQESAALNGPEAFADLG